MKAMILAAGKGTRLQPMTLETPKPLIPLVGRPILDLILQSLTEQGICDIAINTAHLSDEIVKFCQSGAQYDARILFSYEGFSAGGEQHCRPLGSAGGLRQVQQKWRYFDDTFVVVCGDAYFDVDLWDVVREHNANEALATVVTCSMRDDQLQKYGVVLADDSGRVQSFQEKPLPGTALSNDINTGIYIFDKKIFDYIPALGEYDIGSQLLPAIVSAGCPFYAYQTSGTWLDIGNVQDIHQATQRILDRQTCIKIPGDRIGLQFWAASGAVIKPTSIVTTGGVFINAGTIVEADAVINGPVVIGRNCEVKTGACIERSIVMADHLVFEAHCDIQDKIVTAEHLISLDGTVERWTDQPHLGVRDSRSMPSAACLSMAESGERLIAAR
jgi:mannose-1-phosphate guanylyltransferase